jgi:hypothetical protein
MHPSRAPHRPSSHHERAKVGYRTNRRNLDDQTDFCGAVHEAAAAPGAAAPIIRPAQRAKPAHGAGGAEELKHGAEELEHGIFRPLLRDGGPQGPGVRIGALHAGRSGATARWDWEPGPVGLESRLVGLSAGAVGPRACRPQIRA